MIPTGGGKTRIAMRIGLRVLAESKRDDALVLWVTHRRHLHRQARRELQRALKSNVDIVVATPGRLMDHLLH